MHAQAVPTEFAPDRTANWKSSRTPMAKRSRTHSQVRRRRSSGDWGAFYPERGTEQLLQGLWERYAIKAGVIAACAWCTAVNGGGLLNALSRGFASMF
jgi:hypothetical protein